MTDYDYFGWRRVARRRPAFVSFRYLRLLPPRIRLHGMKLTQSQLYEMRERVGVLVIRRRPEPRP